MENKDIISFLIIMAIIEGLGLSAIAFPDFREAVKGWMPQVLIIIAVMLFFAIGYLHFTQKSQV